MTVNYTQKVSDCKGFGSFWRLLFRWRGSVYKLIWPDTLVYCFLYFICSLVYRFGLDEQQRRTFEQLSLYCDYFRNLIPISFVLGFYVSVVVQRWWEQYQCIPWPDFFAILCTSYIRGRDGPPKLLRSTLLRYVLLSIAMLFSRISGKVRKKLPNLKSILDAGYMTVEEMHILEKQAETSNVPVVCVPLMWCSILLEKGRTQGYIMHDFAMKQLLGELGQIRDKCGMVMRWTDISIPLVYTQVATMAVYSFFFFSVLGRQFLDPAQGYDNRTIDFFVPIFTLLQFFFYMGWLKVAESLVNPFGEDDDDFDMDQLLERHTEMSYLLGYVTPAEIPSMVQDLNNMVLLEGSQIDKGNGGTGGYQKHNECSIPNSCSIKLGLNGKLPKTATLQPRRSSTSSSHQVKPTSLLTSPSGTLKPTATATRMPGSSPSIEALNNIQQPSMGSILTPELASAGTNSSIEDPSNSFDFLWEQMEVGNASDDQNSARDNTPILNGSSGHLEANSPTISSATTPTEEATVTCRFPETQSNSGHPGSDTIRSGHHKSLRIMPGHAGESKFAKPLGVEGRTNPSYVE